MKPIIQVLFIVIALYASIAKTSEIQEINNTNISQDDVQKSIEETLDVLDDVYVYPEKTKAIHDEIIKRMNNGDYKLIKTKQEFVDKISDDLFEISKDRHLSVMLVKPDEVEPTHVLIETKDERKYNFAFQRIEVLNGNIGYVKFNKFYQDEEAQITVDHAFGFLANTDAMIIDLRDNIGGSPELVRYILSHFFNEKTLLWRSHSRANKEIYDNESIEGVGAQKFKTNYPLFVLVSADTASAAEIFSYTLKHLGKATIIGETTVGMAHGVSAVKINDYFSGRFSMSRPSSPITHTSWEGVGVIPNIPSTAEQSLKIAHTQALKALGIKSKSISQDNID
jgi:hypothetical protein